MGTNTLASPNQSGFALLLTLLVVGVLISIGLSVLDLSIKQIRLSTNSKDSEISFHAANAGMECARYWRREASSTMETGAAISPTCFSASPDSNTRSPIVADVSGDGDVYLYEYSFTWGGVTPRCSHIKTLVMVATSLGSDLTMSDVANHIPGYPDIDKTCIAGERCTVQSVRGYNRACSSVSSYGTVEREVLLQF